MKGRRGMSTQEPKHPFRKLLPERLSMSEVSFTPREVEMLEWVRQRFSIPSDLPLYIKEHQEEQEVYKDFVASYLYKIEEAILETSETERVHFPLQYFDKGYSYSYNPAEVREANQLLHDYLQQIITYHMAKSIYLSLIFITSASNEFPFPYTVLLPPVEIYVKLCGLLGFANFVTGDEANNPKAPLSIVANAWNDDSVVHLSKEEADILQKESLFNIDYALSSQLERSDDEDASVSLIYHSSYTKNYIPFLTPKIAYAEYQRLADFTYKLHAMVKYFAFDYSLKIAGWVALHASITPEPEVEEPTTPSPTKKIKKQKKKKLLDS